MTLHHYWIQTKDLTVASIKSRYRKTWAGFLWVILNPIMLFGVQSLVFRKFLRIDVPSYFLFLLGGLLPWIFITSTIQMGTPLFVSQAQLLRSFKINPWVILSSQVLDGFINFIASFLLIMLPFYFYYDKSVVNLLALPLATIPLLIGTLSLTVTFSILNVFYRDINFVMGFIFSLLFFLTPIFYPKEFVPAEWQWLIKFNPIIYLIEPFREVLHQSVGSEFFSLLLQSFLISLGLAIVAIFTWKRKQNDFYRYL